MDKVLYNAIKDINISNASIRQIYDETIDYYYNNPPIQISEDRLNTLIVNRIRHSFSNYNNTLKIIRKINDSEETEYHIYKNAVLNKIGQQYPNLLNECNRQKSNIELFKLK